MAYFPRSDASDAKAMLAAIGVDSVEHLFASIPEELRATASIKLPPGLDEATLVQRIRELADANRPLTQSLSFVGAGVYAYPPVAAALYAISRGEFLTAYTPYQPEIAQGTLMAIFEFQTWVSELSGMPIANASMYDGATALAEAVLMGLRAKRKARRVVLSAGIAPDVRRVIELYLGGQKDLDIVTLPLTAEGSSDLAALKRDGMPCVVALASPNAYGVIESLPAWRAALGEEDFLVVHTPDPHIWLLQEPPGTYGVDAATAEGQPLGVPPSFGGPLLGLFTTQPGYLRTMPGRICGETIDQDHKRGYVLTLSTREQHIRREKATSNICSNQGVIALLATVSMAVLGPSGLRARALAAAHRARELLALLEAHGAVRRYSAPFFNEFVIDHPEAAALWQAAVDDGIQLGMPLSHWHPDDATGLLLAATAQSSDDLKRVERWLKTQA